jgi:hypothetical protein
MAAAKKKPLYQSLYFQVVVAIILACCWASSIRTPVRP